MTVGPLDSDRRVRIARRTEGATPRSQSSTASATARRGLIEPLSDRQRARSSRPCEGRADAHVRHGPLAPADPDHHDVRFCVGSYFAELDRRMEAGFDTASSRFADITEFVEPAGMVLLAMLAGEPVGCGALRFGEDAATEIKRMWLSPGVRGLGIGRRLLGSWSSSARTRCAARPARHQPCADRGDRDVPRCRVRRGAGLQRRASRRPLVREAARVAVAFGRVMTVVSADALACCCRRVVCGRSRTGWSASCWPCS